MYQFLLLNFLFDEDSRFETETEKMTGLPPPELDLAETVWLGGVAPLPARRALEDVGAMLASVPKTARRSLTPTELSKLKARCEVGIENKFTLMKPLTEKDGKLDLESVNNVYSLVIRTQELRTALASEDMADVFLIANAYVRDEDMYEDVPARGASPVNLFTSYQDVTLDLVKKASAFIMNRGQNYHVQNLLWSGAKILNSCDSSLRSKIEEKTLSYTLKEKTGLVYWKILTDLVTSSAARSLRVLLNQFTTIGLSDVEGEDVNKMVSAVEGMVQQLQNNNMLPEDALTIVADIFKKSSTEAFRNYIDFLMNNHDEGINKLTIPDLLASIERKYAEFLIGNKWEAANNKEEESAFLTCFKCGKEGHIARDCESSETGGRGGRGGGGRSGRGRSRGNGGRGRGRGSRAGGRVPDSNKPPGPGEPRSKKVNNKTVFWCGRCGRWGDHSTDHHKAMVANIANSDEAGAESANNTSAGNQQANVVTTQNEPGTTANLATPQEERVSYACNQAAGNF